MAKNEKQITDLTYEQAFSELDAIVNTMETEQKPLDESMKLFERGQKLAQYCAELLDNADLKIKELATGKNLVDRSE